MKKPTLTNVYDEATTEAVSNDYPYGRLRCTAKWWIEDNGKKGMRVCFQTINPKTGRINAPKKGNYWPVVILVKNPENGHFENHTVSNYSDVAELEKFLDTWELRERDAAFLRAWIAGKKKLAERLAQNPIRHTITETPAVNISDL